MQTMDLFFFLYKAQPFFFDTEEATYYRNDSVWSLSDNNLELNYSQLGVNIKKRKVILNYIGIKHPNKDCFSSYRIEDRFFNEEKNIYVYHFYNWFTQDRMELVFFNDFKNADLKSDWNEDTAYTG